ncbi:coiled-coil domain-containing protein 66 isoform X5 [Microtus pennsylvanicus]|uniref:coiled-coil domain-containing protein 66 isoform X5 n=1 Tax=Microtus pennsylvanicus TaxID=10058 RepID=UPI003F6C33F0
MNLGDGLKLETELLDGKTKLILSPYEHKSKVSVKMGNKIKIAKCPLRIKQTGHILRSTQNSYTGSENVFQKKLISSETSQARSEKSRLPFSPSQGSCQQHAEKDCLHFPKESSPAASTAQKIINTADKCRVAQQKPCKTHISENMNSSVVCLTQDQLQQILMSVSQGSGSVSLAENGKEEKASQDSFQLISAPSQLKGVNATGSLQKTEAVSPVSDEGKCVLSRAQEALQQCEQKMAIENEWKPADIFSTLGERERDRSLLEARRVQWKKELDEQVALKKKEKEASQKWNDPWTKSELECEKLHILDQSKLEPSEEQRAKPVTDMSVSYSQKTNFLRSMTALLDPAQIEEREKRRHKQLEHQKAIMAQVEENRRKKQQEEEQRKKEEQEEEQRLAREREEMQRQYEEDILKQKQKEEIMTLKTNQLFHTMQRAQELAQRLKQEQRIRELTQKGHDTSRLIKNLGTIVDYKACTTISSSGRDAGEAAEETRAATPSTNSPRTDIGVQTDDLNLGIFNNELQHCGSLTERGTRNFSSPEISTEFNGHTSTKKDKQELSTAKGTNLDKESSWHNGQCSQYRRTEKQTKHSMKKCPKKPAWNINKPLKRYVPASARYPIHLQKEKEEKKLRRQMELLHLLERNNPENLSQNRGPSPQVLAPSHRETESENRLQLIKKAEEPLKTSDIKEWFQLSAIKSRTQQTQTDSVHSPLKNSDYEKKNLALGDGQTQLSEEMSETTHFIPYVRTNEIYYLDPDAPLSRPSTQENQYQKSHDCDQQELFNSDHIRDPLLNPKLVKNRDRQQAILKGLSELRQGLLQKQKELETNLIPLTANQEDNFSSSF